MIKKDKKRLKTSRNKYQFDHFGVGKPKSMEHYGFKKTKTVTRLL